MKITVIGCGSAFTSKNYNQSFFLEEDGRKMLIDCGRDIPNAFNNMGIDFKSINDIYISHAHGDHIGGLEYFALKRYDWLSKPRNYREKCYAPKLIADEVLLKNIWNNSLRGGLETMEGFVADLDTFFIPHPLPPNRSFNWQAWTISLVQQVHVMSGSVIMPSFGLFIEKKDHKSIYFTIDAQFMQPKQVQVFYGKADIIIQDCECIGICMKDKEFVFGTGVHANYAELAGFPSANAPNISNELKSKIYLSHYQDFVLENIDYYGNKCDWQKRAKKDGFAGFLEVGQTFEI